MSDKKYTFKQDDKSKMMYCEVLEPDMDMIKTQEAGNISSLISLAQKQGFCSECDFDDETEGESVTRFMQSNSVEKKECEKEECDEGNEQQSSETLSPESPSSLEEDYSELEGEEEQDEYED